MNSLMAASLISLFTSILFLSLFSFPHSPDMPVIPSWQEVGPDILSNFYDTHNEPWQEEDSSSKLLTSVASVVESLGYDRAIFYLPMAPYWNTLIITLNVFCLSMILTSIVMS